MAILEATSPTVTVKAFAFPRRNSAGLAKPNVPVVLLELLL